MALTADECRELLMIMLDDSTRHVQINDGLTRLDPVCGLPHALAFMRYFKERSRYVGFIVFPGARIEGRTRSAVLAVMDSLRVATRP